MTTKKKFTLERLAVPLLLLVLLLAAMLRFTGLNWDDGTHLHPDERFLTGVTAKLHSDSFRDYLTTSESTLNPYNVGEGFFVYGNFPMTATRLAAEAVASFCLTGDGVTRADYCPYNFTGYDGVHLLGRFLSGLVDIIAVAFLFFIGRRLYGWQVGLLAATLLATAVMPIQQSHFYTMDTWAAALTTITLYAAVRAAALGDETVKKRYHWWVLFGISLGLTVASRINMAPLALIVNVSAVIWLNKRGHNWNSLLNSGRGGSDLMHAITGVMLAAIFSIIVFRVANPYAFADKQIALTEYVMVHGQEPNAVSLWLRSAIGFNPQWTNNMVEIQRLQSPDAAFPPATQWASRAPILFPLTNMILYGMGIVAGVMAWLGFLWAGWRLLKLRPDWTAHAIPVIWSGTYFLFMATRWVKSIRYFLPVYPTLLLLAGWVLIAICRRAVRSENRAKQIAAAGLTAVTILSSFLWANAFTEIYRQPMTRNAASAWMYENVPTAATIFYEADGEARQLQLPLKQFAWNDGGLPLTVAFALPEEGTITAVSLNNLTDLFYNAGQPPNAAQLSVYLGALGGDGTMVDLQLDDQKQDVFIDIADKQLAAGEFDQLIVEHRGGTAVAATTSLIANEHWDDLLPTNIDGKSGYGMYYTEVSGGQRPVTHPDSPEKRIETIQWLDQADYIALSSQRAAWSVPRIPATYPMMIRYYEALFSGELGFELVHEAHGDIHIGPLYISDTGAELGWGELPSIGWPPPGDLAAEEAFSVYDHPPVWIFRKTAAYSHENTAAILNAVDVNNVIFMTPGEASKNQDAPPTMLLSEDEADTQQAGGTFADLFNPDGVLAQNPWLAAVVWITAVILLGWLAFPITFTAFHGLPDKGYALSRILSLLLVSYFGWLMASLKWLPNSRATLLLGVLLIGLVSAFLFVRRRAEMGEFLKKNGRYFLLIELLGIALFLIYFFVRLGNPDVWDIIWGGEKPMDLSYFTAVMKSTTFPPYDPWYAGGTLNYYYYGFVYVGAMAKLLAIPPAIAYNVGMGMLFSFVGLGAFSAAFNLVVASASHLKGDRHLKKKKAVFAGLIALSLAILLGNLAEPSVLMGAWYKTGDPTLETKLPVGGTLARTLDGAIKIASGEPAPVYPGDYFWNATRAINYEPGEVQPITEFPFFTFLYGDLHAHMISMPLQLLALGWAIGLALSARGRGGAGEQGSRGAGALIVSFLVGGLVIGSLRAINTWDFPTYLVIGALAVLFWAWKGAGKSSSSSPLLPRSPAPHLSAPLLFVAGTAVLWSIAFLSFYPFAANYVTGYSSLSAWQGSYTHASRYLIVWGLFLFFIIPHLAREFRDWSNSLTPKYLRQSEAVGWLAVAGLIVLVALIFWMWTQQYWIAPILLPLIMLAGLLSLRRTLPTPRRIVLVLISAALFLTLFVEVAVLDGDIGRMNTVFKFYMQAWLMLSVVGGLTAVWTYPAIRQRKKMHTIWSIALGVLLFSAVLYPVLATGAKWRIRMNPDAPNTLDGMAFMPHVQYGERGGQTLSLASDYEALNWMQRNIDGSPVIMEAHSDNPYRSIGNRVAMYTGLPSVIGWDWHQRQQRAAAPDSGVPARITDVNAFYNAPDSNFANFIIDKYGVEYIYVGPLEWAYYDPNGLTKFDQMVTDGLLEEVYRNPETSIYRVIDSE